MTTSGPEEIWNKTFSGVKKMLSGKKFSINFQALRMVVESCCKMTFRNYLIIMNYQALSMMFQKNVQQLNTE